ncbi:MAG: hypothetical protein KDE51_18180, partial [Anaerolineales bacterium]|nr:hypothetical protein [Anaerolineales bacterium]
WFAEHGRIFNIAVSPRAQVQIQVYKRTAERPSVVIHAENYGERYVPKLVLGEWERHPLLEAAVLRMGVPDELAIEINIYAEAPAGASTGSSAAVTVALLGALDWLTSGRLTAHEIAYLAQAVETEMLGQQCGIQDQLAAAYGGVNYIEMFQYPYATVSSIHLPEVLWWELEQRLLLIYLGSSHDSSQVHETVIRGLEDAGSDALALNQLRQTAVASRDAVWAGDFATLGQVMIANTEAQRALHPALVSEAAQEIIAIAQAYAALGWKVNGAGGEGGSLTLLGNGQAAVQRALIRVIEEANPLFKHIPTQLSRDGLRVWES